MSDITTNPAAEAPVAGELAPGAVAGTEIAANPENSAAAENGAVSATSEPPEETSASGDEISAPAGDAEAAPMPDHPEEAVLTALDEGANAVNQAVAMPSTIFEWIRRELHLHANGLDEDERKALNPDISLPGA